MKFKPLSFENAKTYPLSERNSKVSIDKLGKPFNNGSFQEFINSLPDFLGAKDFIEVVDSIVQAKQQGRLVVLGMGAHPIKVGLSPIIINLIEKNIIDAVCLNGACIIHDFELSYLGQTSEDVAVELTKGTFGMAEETGKILNKAINEGVSDGLGLGESIGKLISNSSYPYKNYSIIANGYNKQIPVTVHVAVGTDIIHMHPEADGEKIGQGSHKDFRLMASVVANLDSGVYINLGSSVILPEVFLKALNIARNLGYKVENLTTVNMDFIQHYRPRENVLKRPTINTGRGYALVGHHEIMFPLLAASILNKLEVKT